MKLLPYFAGHRSKYMVFLYTYSLTLCILMDFPIHIDTISMGQPIVYFKESQVVFSLNYDVFLSLKAL